MERDDKLHKNKQMEYDKDRRKMNLDQEQVIKQEED